MYKQGLIIKRKNQGNSLSTNWAIDLHCWGWKGAFSAHTGRPAVGERAWGRRNNCREEERYWKSSCHRIWLFTSIKQSKKNAIASVLDLYWRPKSSFIPPEPQPSVMPSTEPALPEHTPQLVIQRPALSLALKLTSSEACQSLVLWSFSSRMELWNKPATWQMLEEV